MQRIDVAGCKALSERIWSDKSTSSIKVAQKVRNTPYPLIGHYLSVHLNRYELLNGITGMKLDSSICKG